MFTNSTLRKFVENAIFPACWLTLLVLWFAAGTSAVPQEDSTWRMTRFGWENSSTWQRPAVPQFERRIELVHPVTFSAVIALASLAVLIWATEEYDWGRLIQKRQPTIRQQLDQLEKANPNPD